MGIPDNLILRTLALSSALIRDIEPAPIIVHLGENRLDSFDTRIVTFGSVVPTFFLHNNKLRVFLPGSPSQLNILSTIKKSTLEWSLR